VPKTGDRPPPPLTVDGDTLRTAPAGGRDITRTRSRNAWHAAWVAHRRHARVTADGGRNAGVAPAAAGRDITRTRSRNAWHAAWVAYRRHARVTAAGGRNAGVAPAAAGRRDVVGPARLVPGVDMVLMILSGVACVAAAIWAGSGALSVAVRLVIEDRAIHVRVSQYLLQQRITFGDAVDHDVERTVLVLAVLIRLMVADSEALLLEVRHHRLVGEIPCGLARLSRPRRSIRRGVAIPARVSAAITASRLSTTRHHLVLGTERPPAAITRTSPYRRAGLIPVGLLHTSQGTHSPGPSPTKPGNAPGSPPSPTNPSKCPDRNPVRRRSPQ
jgi:hypothetical protein